MPLWVVNALVVGAHGVREAINQTTRHVVRRQYGRPNPAAHILTRDVNFHTILTSSVRDNIHVAVRPGVSGIILLFPSVARQNRAHRKADSAQF